MTQPTPFAPMDRRSFLRGSTAFLAASALGQDPLPPVKALGRHRKTLVVVFLRGGCDGLHLVVPHGDPNYARLRPGLAVPGPGEANGVAAIDETFGLHPAASALGPLFQSGVATAIHAVGHPGNTRSHFEEQDRWETLSEPSVETQIGMPGWLGRYLALEGQGGPGPIRALALGKSVPRSLRGTVPALAIDRLDELRVAGNAKGLDATMAALRRTYARGQVARDAAKTSAAARKSHARDLLAREGDATLDAMRRLSSIASKPFEPKGIYPGVPVGAHLREAARLIDSDLGLEVIQIDHDGFDTHQNQARSWDQVAAPLAQGLAAFFADIEARGHLDNVLVLAVSEFGRTARVNGTGGTDHGSGGCVLALGGSVKGPNGEPRGVIGDWPTLAQDALHEARDLRTTTDIRDVYAEALTAFLGVKRPDRVLPGWKGQPVRYLI